MKRKRTLLVIGDYCRADILYFFEGLKDDFLIYFLYYTSKNEIPKTLNLHFGKVIFYHQYLSAFHLLKKLKPEKVLFFDIESYNQVAIITACKQTSIPTFHVEHGYRNYELSNYLNTKPIKTSSIKTVTTKKNKPIERIKNRLFYLLTALQCDQKDKLIAYKKKRENSSIFESLSYLGKLDLVPDRFISFSPKIFEFHKKILSLKQDAKVDYVGFLYADKYYSAHSFKNNRKIVFIDACYHTTELFGVTTAFVTDFYSNLNSICTKYNYQLFVKKHPNDNTSAIDNAGVKIISDNDFLNNLHDFSIIAGDYSTLFLILIGLPHTVAICFDMFPDPNFNPVTFLTNYHVCQLITQFTELETILKEEQKIEALYKNQISFKPGYINEFLYKLDGKAKVRFNQIILS